jgi:hypothetical protein
VEKDLQEVTKAGIDHVIIDNIGKIIEVSKQHSRFIR